MTFTDVGGGGCTACVYDHPAGTPCPAAPSRAVTSPCPNCEHEEERHTYDVGSGPELSCAKCEWCWGADGQELKPVPMPDGLPSWTYPEGDERHGRR